MPDSVINLDAKYEYNLLRRELSKQTLRSSLSNAEEGAADKENFDLNEFLHGISKEHDANGHKPKHLGVSWKDLHVEVISFII